MIANLLRQLADLIDKPPKLDIVTYKIGGHIIGQKLTDMGIDHPFGLLDSEYFATDLAGWKKVLPHLLQDGYRDTFQDCENMAMQAMLDSSVKYGVNAMGMCIGWNGGYHAFNILYAADLAKFMLFESIRDYGYGGVPFELGEKKYAVYKVLI